MTVLTSSHAGKNIYVNCRLFEIAGLLSVCLQDRQPRFLHTDADDKHPQSVCSLNCIQVTLSWLLPNLNSRIFRTWTVIKAGERKCHEIVKQPPSTWYFIFKFRFLQKSLEEEKCTWIYSTCIPIQKRTCTAYTSAALLPQQHWSFKTKEKAKKKDDNRFKSNL